MRAHVLQHVAFEGAGRIQTWLEAAGATVTRTRLFDDEPLPRVADVDLIVAMGGPMSVNDEATLPWLAGEKRLIRQAIESDVAVVGVCLGSQLIASAMGARVYPSREKEIGWFPVTAVEPAAADEPFRLPAGLQVFHWHGETFDLPDGAVHLARSAACEHQAFRIGNRVLGLQCHLEVTPDGVRDLAGACAAELVPGAWIQPASRLAAEPAATYDAMGRVLDDLLQSLVGSGVRS